ncbi:xanthine dehydrogenase family protein molybdopterin-binding subunit [Neptuniibacter sp. CAU 1671]|uniref:xanthine dehydrogenase family protein molybdopterin-binding subunit n=1 Tax=Neptuniibacter sp. CAU 1671 TaxID=3032593 RepID=UPI0023DB17DC|nr:xanthine dehydrogenase family protein molybdopterin-binding subunit [Neptuniibacter sp. CAU 1671]MDF2180606.1 xanthine dehydrogenase family protein molybdopterin-binding subunit [Neptuniibacter sp. CAU 1671]
MRRMYFHDQPILQANRRDFLKLMTGVGAGLTLGFSTRMALAGETAAATNSAGDFAPNAFVSIDKDSQVTVLMKHLEMGQGAYTGLATLVAEELDADWAQIHAAPAPADAKRYNNLLWGEFQGTGGSSAIANAYMQMRTAGATAKAMLVQAAANSWQVPVSEIRVSNGIVSHAGSGKQAQFGELVDAAAKLPVPDAESVVLKEPSQFKLIGKRVTRKDVGKTDGTAIFTQDIQIEGMLTAVVAHPPRFGATVKSFDASKALAAEGVKSVVQIPEGVAVVASDYWRGKKARELLQIEWDESAAMTQGSDEIIAEYKALALKSGLVARSEGDVAATLAAAPRTIEATYAFPYLAHAAMEPLNCVALVTDQGCEIWNGEQLHTGDQMAIAGLLNIKPEQVKMNMLFAGGSFGRRANPKSDYLIEAVNIAKTQPGTPVKLVWSREDDMLAGYYRPIYVHRLQAGLDEAGKIVAWQQHIVGQSVVAGSAFEGFLIKDGIDGTSVEGAANLPYAIPNLQVELTTTQKQVPVQWWRSVGSTHTAFAAETFMDELASQLGQDPVELRMQLLEKHPRWQGVLKLAAEKANWGAPLPEGWGRGVAVHESFHSYVAQVAEVSVQPNGQYKVERVVCAVDCGVAVNPDVIKAQMEGCIGFGLGPVINSEITLTAGKVDQTNYHNYQVARINNMLRVEVFIVPSAEPPTGVGEPGVPPLAPAVANALAAATGKRFYQLPIKPDAVKA